MVSLLELSAADSGREDFGPRMSELRQLGSLGPISRALREEPHVRSVLELLLRHEHMYKEALLLPIPGSPPRAAQRAAAPSGCALEVSSRTAPAVRVVEAGVVIDDLAVDGRWGLSLGSCRARGVRPDPNESP
ncbi:AraC family transcriptional regulator [Streptomyces sp. NBC_00234]|uniref:AraC family transcriptional regulator ligand-binding domain-containing protein n=1 Tax=Streptomyces sp. NBC_00234 TaxID=2903638 RepID=UPI002E2B2016|nr:AraC family transcriptional regulator ligand-binding domain-containing protein [Streptomyces sp. NBC_00234]